MPVTAFDLSAALNSLERATAITAEPRQRDSNHEGQPQE
jgi:hypothetical protein